jgi:hypothetical protein
MSIGNVEMTSRCQTAGAISIMSPLPRRVLNAEELCRARNVKTQGFHGGITEIYS